VKWAIPYSQRKVSVAITELTTSIRAITASEVSISRYVASQQRLVANKEQVATSAGPALVLQAELGGDETIHHFAADEQRIAGEAGIVLYRAIDDGPAHGDEVSFDLRLHSSQGVVSTIITHAHDEENGNGQDCVGP